MCRMILKNYSDQSRYKFSYIRYKNSEDLFLRFRIDQLKIKLRKRVIKLHKCNIICSYSSSNRSNDIW